MWIVIGFRIYLGCDKCKYKIERRGFCEKEKVFRREGKERKYRIRSGIVKDSVSASRK